MRIFQSLKEIVDAVRIKKKTTHAEEEEFKYRRSSMLQERSIIQQLHKELLDSLKEMEHNNPPIRARLIQVDPQFAKYMSIASKNVRLLVYDTPSLGVFRIEREEDVLS